MEGQAGVRNLAFAARRIASRGRPYSIPKTWGNQSEMAGM